MMINKFNSVLSRTGIGIAALVTALLFMALTMINLGSIGGYYDELHQAVPSFAYLGKQPMGFSAMTAYNLPLLNQSYSGAIKTALYGMYLKIGNTEFTLYSWRLFGIVIISLTLFLTTLKLHKRVPRGILLIFYALLLTDAAVLLQVRHDWGPVALALAFRLWLLGLWAHAEYSEKISLNNSFMMGLLLPLSVFEKLCNVVLIVPGILLFVCSGRRSEIRHYLSAVGGGLVGAIPLVTVNILSYTRDHSFISLAAVEQGNLGKSVHEIFQLIYEYLSLGAGVSPREFVLGVHNGWAGGFECVFISIFIVLILGSWVICKANPNLKRAALLMGCYLAVEIGLQLLPQQTKNIHWIIGTPFQYLSIGFFVIYLTETSGVRMRMLTYVTLIGLVCFCLYRGVNIGFLENEFRQRRYEARWTPDLNEAMKFSNHHKHDALFISLDWGAGSALICGTQGERHSFRQMNYFESNAIYVIPSAMNHITVKDIYLIDTAKSLFLDKKARQERLEEILNILGKDWRTEVLPDELIPLKELEIVRLHKSEAS